MRDPVCGMTVGPDAATLEGYPEFGFCSEHCRAKFTDDPESYLDEDNEPGPTESAEHEPSHPLEAEAKVPSIHLSVIPGSHHRRFGPVMWGAIGVTFMVLAVVAVYGLEPRIAGYAVAALVLVCIVVCGAAFWLDAGTARATTRLVEQLRRRSNH